MSLFRENMSSGARLLSALIMLYLSFYGIVCCLKLETFQYTDFDLAVHTQSLYNLLDGSIDSSLLGIPFPGNHMALSLLLIAPFYLLFPTPATLLVIQTAVLSAGAAALYLYAKRHLQQPYPAIVSCLYLFYPPLIYMNLYEFHPVALAATLLIMALLAYDLRRPAYFAGAAVLAMMCQENISLIIFMMGIKAMLDRRGWRWSAACCASGTAWFFLCVSWLMPGLNPGVIRFDSIYGHLGGSLTEIAFTIIRHPFSSLAYMMSLPHILYLSALLLPLAFISLLAPAQLIPALPVLVQRLLSERASETTILFHYQAELIPFIFIAAVHGLARLKRLIGEKWLPAAAIAMAALTAVSFYQSGLPETVYAVRQASRSRIAAGIARNRLLDSIPGDASVAATFRYLPHLAARKQLHSVHHIYTGYYTLSDKPYPVPETIDCLAIDADDPLTFGTGGFYTRDGYKNLQALIETNGLKPFFISDSIILLKRNCEADSSGSPLEPSVLKVKPTDEGGPFPSVADLTFTRKGDRLLLTIKWLTPSVRSRDFYCLIDVESGPGLPAQHFIAPGYRIFPPVSWPACSEVTTSHILPAPEPPCDNLRFNISIVPIEP